MIKTRPEKYNPTQVYKMKIKTITLTLIIALANTLLGQDLSLKQKAIEEFKKEHYETAISILERAVKESPNDA